MTEETQDKMDINYIDILPMELINKIFSNLSIKDVIKCRRLSVHWKSIIDGTVSIDSYWQKACEKDFGNCYKTAQYKTRTQMSWFSLYKCLSLWPALSSAKETYNEFATACAVSEEILNIVLLKNGVLGVHTKSAIDYYDSNTLNFALRDPIQGNYSYFMENENAVVVKSYHLHAILVRKILNSKLQRSFENIKLSLLTDDALYLVTLSDEIYFSDILSTNITYEFLALLDERDGVMCLGYDNGKLYILTYQRNIYLLEKDKEIVFVQCLDAEQNILNVLYKYNFLEHLDWRIYFQWMYVLSHAVPDDPIANITIVKPYGDIFFVGTQFGQVFIYNKPFTSGELDIFNAEPMSHFDLMDPSEFCASQCVILQIDVLEIETGHIVFVATPKKIGIFKFTHDYLCHQNIETSKGFVAI